MFRWSGWLKRGAALLLVSTFCFPVGSSAQNVRSGVKSNVNVVPVYRNLPLDHGRTATVYSDGRAVILSKSTGTVEFDKLPLALSQPATYGVNPSNTLPDKAHVMFDLMKGRPRPFVDGRVLVVFRPGVTMQSDVTTLSHSTVDALRHSAARGKQSTVATPSYTNDGATNRVLAQLTVQRSERLFRHVAVSTLSSMHARAQARVGKPLLNLENAYRLDFAGTSVQNAVKRLLKLSSVEYATPDWTITGQSTGPISIPESTYKRGLRAASPSVAIRVTHEAGMTSNTLRIPTTTQPRTAQGTTATAAQLPSNYGLTASGQSLLNAPSTDAAAAFDEIQRHFGQLPGQGEIITNVSIGDLDDSSSVTNSNDPCHPWTSFLGPTTKLVNGQRYIDWPTLPLIPTYASDPSGNLSGNAEVCGVDPFLGEVGLDFSMMAPLPDALQRPGAQASGLGDLLGVAPGAQYRLVVPYEVPPCPAGCGPSMSDLDGSFMGAALQTPAPNVITASLGFGLDAFGFPSRYLEEDPITQAVIAYIVNTYNIVVCISAGDGTRVFTNVPIGPSGGSAATDLATSPQTATNLNDLALSTVPSRVIDTGSIDVGGTTLNDIFSVQPQYASGAAQAQHAYAQTRWNGFTAFSSGFGGRVNVSAPSDNVLAFAFGFDNNFSWGPQLFLQGGTSASAPEVAASAAVALQVARLTGHPLMTVNSVRTLLEQTGNPVPDVPQADQKLNVGPQVDVRKVVETLLQEAGVHESISVPRVAISWRRPFGWGAGNVFLTDLDPTFIDLDGPYPSTGASYPNGFGLWGYSWITIAPDWEFVTPQTKYTLTVDSTHKVLATTPWARLLPQTILSAAGMPFVSSSSHTVNLTYSAAAHGKSTHVQFSMTFGPTTGTDSAPLAPEVPPVITGSTVPVTYDISNMQNLSNPVLVVSTPARFSPFQDGFLRALYSVPLTALKGTISVPVSSLAGSGIYGIAIYNTGTQPLPRSPLCNCWSPWIFMSNFAFTRVVGTALPTIAKGTSRIRPPAPLLSAGGSPPGHFLDVSYATPFQVSYDVSNVAGATGAELEISAAGPTATSGNINPFNNPNGTVTDNNGVDTGDVFMEALPGTTGTVTIDPVKDSMLPSFNHVIRVLPMAGSIAVGEAGEVSTVAEDGVVTNDGGNLFWGYSINPNGNDGFLTSWSRNSNTGLQTASSVQTFDQTSNQIQQTVASSGDTVYLDRGPALYPNDIGVFGSQNMLDPMIAPYVQINYPFLTLLAMAAFGDPTYNTLSPATSAVGPWTSPFTDRGENLFASANDIDANVEFLSNHMGSTFKVFASNLTNNTAGTPIDITSQQSVYSPGYSAFAYFALGENSNTHESVIAGGDISSCGSLNAPMGSPTLLTTIGANGNVNSFTTTAGGGAPEALAVDSSTNRVAIADGCSDGFSIYDLSTNTLVTHVQNFGECCSGDIFNIEVDETAHRFIMTDFLTQGLGDANALLNIMVYDENGNLLKSIERFNMLGLSLHINNSEMQIHPSNHSGYILGPSGTQLEPFSY